MTHGLETLSSPSQRSRLPRTVGLTAQSLWPAPRPQGVSIRIEVPSGHGEYRRYGAMCQGADTQIVQPSSG